MPETLTCPQCNCQLRVPDQLLGKKIKCPSCGVNFTASAAGGARAATEEPEGALDEEGEEETTSPSSGRPLQRKRFRRAGSKSSLLVDFLVFRKMITPIIIQIIFWMAVAFSLIFGLVSILMVLVASPHVDGLITLGGLFGSVLWMIVGPVIARVYCEILILFFRMNDTLTEIKNNTDRL